MQSTDVIKKFYLVHLMNKVHKLIMQCCSAGQNKMSTLEHDSTREEKRLWKKCNELFQSDKKLTKFYTTSLIIHIAVLVFVTLSVS